MNERLRFFIYLVDSGSFTKAAEVLHISQPALSIALQKLESELGMALLLRRHRTFTLTEGGKLTYAAAKEMGVQTANLKLQLAELSHQKPAISMGMIDSVADALFVYDDYFDELDKHVKISLSVNDSTRLLEMLARDEIDLAIISGQPALIGSPFEESLISQEPLIIVTHTDALQTVQTSLADGKLPQFLSYNQSSLTYRLIRQALAERGVEITPSFYSTSPEILLKVVLSKRGTTVLPYLTVKHHLAAGKLSAIAIKGSPVIARPIRLVKQKNRHLSSLILPITQQIKSIHTRLNIEISQLGSRP